MDRVEAALERLVAAQERDHDDIALLASVAKMQRERTNIIEANIATMQAEEAVYRETQRAKDTVFGERVDKLVSAIGEFISRIPPPKPE